MTQIITVFTCDICKKEVAERDLIKNVRLPFLTHCDWTEGKSMAKHIEFDSADICRECLLKATNLICDFQGSNKRLKEENT